MLLSDVDASFGLDFFDPAGWQATQVLCARTINNASNMRVLTDVMQHFVCYISLLHQDFNTATWRYRYNLLDYKHAVSATTTK